MEREPERPGSVTSPRGVVGVGTVALVGGTVPGRVVDGGRVPPESGTDGLLPPALVTGPGAVTESECPPEETGTVDNGIDGVVVVGGLAMVVVVVDEGQRVEASDGARGGGSAGVALPSGWKRQPSTSPLETFHEAGPTLA